MKKFLTLTLIICLVASTNAFASNVTGPGMAQASAQTQTPTQIVAQSANQIATSNVNNGTLEQILAQSLSHQNTNYEVGLERLAKTISKMQNIECSVTNAKKLTDTSYLVTIQSSNWTNGDWVVDIYPVLPQYEQAPKNGYWFNLYSNDYTRLAICQAYRYKTEKIMPQ